MSDNKIFQAGKWVDPRPMTQAEFLALPPIQVDRAGSFTGLVYIGKGNVYAALQDSHGDNFLISAPLNEDGSNQLGNVNFCIDVEGTEWCEVSEGLGPEGELV